jgi:toxin ParE1/3/4
VKVLWTKLASRHLEGIRSYTGWSSPSYATAIVTKIVRAVLSHSKLELPGMEVPEYGDPDVREIYVHPYRVIFKLTTKVFAVLAVYHARETSPNHHLNIFDHFTRVYRNNLYGNMSTPRVCCIHCFTSTGRAKPRTWSSNVPRTPFTFSEFSIGSTLRK